MQAWMAEEDREADKGGPVSSLFWKCNFRGWANDNNNCARV